MTSYEQLKVERDARGVLHVAIDLSDRSVNVFEERLFLELSDVIGSVETDPSIRLVVFRSAKEIGFMAGADVHLIRRLANEEESQSALRAGQDLFQRVADL
ncbi:MAG: hypothetical protein KF861_01260, partial [Planctomycetaceae bacterium]|nr:hypothetical protein [Planctomycetaceae bacterium]